MGENKKILLSGVKPTGRPHIGNYFGAMKQFVELQDKYESSIFIADYHALTTIHNSDELNKNIIDIALDYLAIGLDPNKVTLYKQSDIPQVAELAWIFNCITTMPYLMRAPAFKDAKAKNKEINVGTFDYPMLMAADILLYDADVVPVGQDQKQHVEITRDTAEKFNRLFGETFKLPEPLILEEVAVVPGIDGQKMSKSYNNTIPLFASKKEIAKQVMSIETDSITTEQIVVSQGETKVVPFAQNVFAIHSLIKSQEELLPFYAANKDNYKTLKEVLIEDIDAYVSPFRTKREELEKDRNSIIEILKNGGSIAKAKAEEKMKIVKNNIGVTL